MHAFVHLTPFVRFPAVAFEPPHSMSLPSSSTAHGATPANARLRIVQIPGPPVIATLTVAEVRSLANNAQSPNEWTDDTSVLVTLQARDANNLAPEGLRMWLDVSNCFVQTRAFELDANGEAGGRKLPAALRRLLSEHLLSTDRRARRDPSADERRAFAEDDALTAAAPPLRR